MEKGFKPLPLSLKIYLVLTLIGLVAFVFVLPASYTTGTNLLGLTVTGVPAVIVDIVLAALSIVIVAGLWNRYPWTWKLAIASLAFGIINSVLGLASLPEQIAAQAETAEAAMIPNYTQFALLVSYTTIAVLIIISALFAYFFYKHRKYFEKPSGA